MSEQYLFVSDCHLTETDTLTTKQFIDFLNKQARQADKLYILGDLFDYWIGDDDGIPRFSTAIAALKNLSEYTEVFFMHGNRDFLIDSVFSEATHCRLLEEAVRVNLNGVATLLLHGDTLCTQDHAYQRYRKLSRHPLTRKLILKTGLKMRQRVAQLLKTISRNKKKTTETEIMDTEEKTVVEFARHYQVDKIIHGHTHRPNRHPIDLGDRIGERIVLGSWQQQCNYLRVIDQQFDYISL